MFLAKTTNPRPSNEIDIKFHFDQRRGDDPKVLPAGTNCVSRNPAGATPSVANTVYAHPRPIQPGVENGAVPA